MFVDEIRRALQGTPRDRLADLSAAVWKGFACGAVSEEDAQQLAVEIEARKSVKALQLQNASTLHRRQTGSRPRSPASIERRRRWAGSGWLPGTIACKFTTAETAALATIAAEIASAGRCMLPIGVIAARAGVCPTIVRTALRLARQLGLVRVEERRQSYARNLSNVITITSPDWSSWVRFRARKVGQGGRMQNRTAPQDTGFSERVDGAKVAPSPGRPLEGRLPGLRRPWAAKSKAAAL